MLGALARISRVSEGAHVTVRPQRGPRQDKQERLAQWRLAARAEAGRLSSLPLTELAAEVMIKGFGPGAPGAGDTVLAGQASVRAGPTARAISFEFVHDRGFSFPVPGPEDIALREQVAMLVAEGLQQLEHASLVLCQRSHIEELHWTATRMGRAALERGEVPQILRSARR
jgi:hypothetical protein